MALIRFQMITETLSTYREQKVFTKKDRLFRLIPQLFDPGNPRFERG